MAAVARCLRAGAAVDWFTAIGTSMRPAVGAVQRVRLRPPAPGEGLLRQVVLARVGGRWWLHRVVDEADGRVLIAGDNGMVNGWTDRADVAGVLLGRD
ncbi:hypothetical protein SAMN04488107_3735 [Geodermatophilus saharensis]|uniref:Peptidase S24-like n=1 Tax=Geodermatophilus saharensis TaxID=1137994 RepID=A0A239H8W8_9ACTN|nr:S26 family signal peptidase [Geodermatophilus saharensis]SNS77488.1 hypothetical protein SAMN04488107_3735 [Geodermatophilus saharensis]